MLQNAGTLHVGGIGSIGTTTLTGDLVQSSTGRTHIDIDPALGRADLLQISGRAALDGTVVVNPISVHKGTSGPVVTAAGGLTITPILEGLAGPVFTHTALVNGNSLSITTDADFKSNDPGRSANQRSVAGYLQRIWDSGAPGFDQGFLSLSRLSSVRAHTQALDSLSGEVQASAITAEVQTAFFVQEAILDRLRFGEGNVLSSGVGPVGTIGSRFAPARRSRLHIARICLATRPPRLCQCSRSHLPIASGGKRSAHSATRTHRRPPGAGGTLRAARDEFADCGARLAGLPAGVWGCGAPRPSRVWGRRTSISNRWRADCT